MSPVHCKQLDLQTLVEWAEEVVFEPLPQFYNLAIDDANDGGVVGELGDATKHVCSERDVNSGGTDFGADGLPPRWQDNPMLTSSSYASSQAFAGPSGPFEAAASGTADIGVVVMGATSVA